MRPGQLEAGDTAPAAVTVSGEDRWLDGDRLHLDSGGDILPDTKQRPGQQMRCGDHVMTMSSYQKCPKENQN